MNKKEYDKLYQASHKEQLRQYRHEYYLKNKEKLNEQSRQYYFRVIKPNLEKMQKRCEYSKQWHRKNVLCTKNGQILYHVNKRDYPEKCELCGVSGQRLEYHHWNDNNLNMGIWICRFCHIMAERVEKQLHLKYFELKNQIQNYEALRE
jgi:hypothetical protein